MEYNKDFAELFKNWYNKLCYSGNYTKHIIKCIVYSLFKKLLKAIDYEINNYYT